MGGQRQSPAALNPQVTRYQLYRGFGGPQGRSVRVRKISPPQGFNPRTVHLVASCYTDWAILAHREVYKTGQNLIYAFKKGKKIFWVGLAVATKFCTGELNMFVWSIWN